jgi:acyl-CoA thioesterase-1
MNKSKTTVRLALLAAFAFAGGGAAAEPVSIVALGDSLTAGYGLPPEAAFPAQLEIALRERGYDVSVTNAGVSGDTAADGLARLEWSIPLGANDALRGIDPSVTRDALDDILAGLAARGQHVLLTGMLAPRNLGDAYAAAFDTIYPTLAEAHAVALYPFFLEGVAADSALNQADGIHPTAEGVGRIVEGILPDVERLIAAAQANG